MMSMHIPSPSTADRRVPKVSSCATGHAARASQDCNARSELLVLRHEAECLADTEVGQDLFGATKDGVELVSAVELFGKLAHAGLGESAATKCLRGCICDLV